MAAMLSHHGLSISEPMVFGLAGALSFAYLPFLKFGNMPLVSYRMFPGHIVKKLPRRLGIKWRRKRYRNPEKAMAELADCVQRRQIAGLQTSAYFTPYFPPEMRFQFNAHNTIAIGRENGHYIISDPVFEQVQRIAVDDLRQARFARGLSAPKGLMHYPVYIPEQVDLRGRVKKAVKKTVNMMLHAPFPHIGIKGMRYLARDIEKLPARRDAVYIRHFLGNIVRMQEEIGTGGGGFRFIYAAFLQEAHQLTGNDAFCQASAAMTKVGDAWRRFAAQCAMMVKQRRGAPDDVADIADMLRSCADREQEVYRLLRGL